MEFVQPPLPVRRPRQQGGAAVAVMLCRRKRQRRSHSIEATPGRGAMGSGVAAAAQKALRLLWSELSREPAASWPAVGLRVVGGLGRSWGAADPTPVQRSQI
mmetsp:Transcript_46706/g.101972  ORF Transcript_46706/g.101972 Transcript_46706/m.101972 type:complete len:102 (+) Transcript_46706:609-914(+)